jgi:hypothetical protein
MLEAFGDRPSKYGIYKALLTLSHGRHHNTGRPVFPFADQRTRNTVSLLTNL